MLPRGKVGPNPCVNDTLWVNYVRKQLGPSVFLEEPTSEWSEVRGKKREGRF